MNSAFLWHKLYGVTWVKGKKTNSIESNLIKLAPQKTYNNTMHYQIPKSVPAYELYSFFEISTWAGKWCAHIRWRLPQIVQSQQAIVELNVSQKETQVYIGFINCELVNVPAIDQSGIAMRRWGPVPVWRHLKRLVMLHLGGLHEICLLLLTTNTF